jgi:hypothetical protein
MGAMAWVITAHHMNGSKLEMWLEGQNAAAGHVLDLMVSGDFQHIEMDYKAVPAEIRHG